MLGVSKVLMSLGKLRRPPPPKLEVIFLVSIAIRKFQKFATNKFKRSLTHHFDRQAALDELKTLHDKNKAFFTQEFVKLTYFVRKFNLTFDDLSSLGIIANDIYQHLQKGLTSDDATNQDWKMLHFLCLSLKYLARNSKTNPLQVSSLDNLIRTTASKHNTQAINDALVSLLEHSLAKSELSSDEISDLKTLILDLPILSRDVRASFLGRLESIVKVTASREEDTATQDKKNRPHASSLKVHKVKKNQQVVSKTIQTVRSKQEKKTSEEDKLKLLDLSDCMKNRNKGRARNAVMERVESTEDGSGSDQSMFRTTWAEVINLFSLASQPGTVLKKEDKDAYLPERFLGRHYFFTARNVKLRDGAARKLYSFFINRMCASIFAKVSMKQQLNGLAVDKLMECVAHFDSLVAKLKLGDDLVKLFVDSTFAEYWPLKKLTSPDIVADFVMEITGKTTVEYENQGWFYNSTEVKGQSYDLREIEEIVSAEIKRLRLDAIKALFNCAKRDKKTVLTKERVEKITKYAETSKEDPNPDAKFEDYIFELIEVAESLDDFDYAETFRIYLSRLPSESGDNVRPILSFLRNQARDMRRSQELFTDDVMKTLITLMGEESKTLDEKQKLELAKIINTCLQHEDTKALSEDNLCRLLDTLLKSDKLINPALTSLLLSTDKTGSMSPCVLNQLRLTNFVDEECTSYVVFILSRVYCGVNNTSAGFIADPGFIEFVSNKMLCDHVAELNDDDDKGQPINFNKPSPEKASLGSSNHISLLAANIILRSVENEVDITPVTMNNMIQILENVDGSNNPEEDGNKQTKIAASKCLYSLSKYKAFEPSVLNQLLDLIDSPVYDVGIYLQAAYLAASAEVARTPELQLDRIHLERMSVHYVPESLVLGQKDYEPEINENLFDTLLHESRKQELTDDKNLFPLFDNILHLNGKYAAKVLGILVAYTFRFAVPKDTVRTLESLLGVSGYFEEALLVLQNVILGGQTSVTSKTLSVLTDYLWQSSNTHLRVYSFKLLDQASQNQELADGVFSKLELVRAGYALEQSRQQRKLAVEQHPTNNRQQIIAFVRSLTDKGMQLPVDTNLALQREIDNVGVLKIFANASRNKQIIGQDLLYALVKLFDPGNSKNKDINSVLIDIFQNAANNNQTLPQNLLGKLEDALSVKDLEKSALLVFNYLAQKGEKLSCIVNHKLLDRLMGERSNPVLIQDLLSSLGSVIRANEAKIDDYLPKINQILVREIRSDNSNIQKLCINTVSKLVTVCKKVDEALLAQLVETCTDSSCSETARNGIRELFDSIDDSHNPSIRQKQFREKIKLANMNSTSSEEMLKQLCAQTDLKLFLQNYNQLKDIISNGTAGLREEALKMLLSYNYKSDLPDALLDSVALLCESTTSDTLRDSCLQLLDGAVTAGKALTGRACEVADARLNRDQNVRMFLQSQVCSKIKQEFDLSDQIMSDLLHSIQASKEIFKVQGLDDLLRLIIVQKTDFFLSESFVLLVERCLLKKSYLHITLPCYCRIVKERKCQRVEVCLQALAENFIKNEDPDSDDSCLLECMHHASKFAKLPDVWMAVAVDSLDSDDEVIRGNMFGILRASKEERFKTILNSWCDLVLESLEEKNKDVKIEKKSEDYMKLDLVEVVVSLKFLDINVLRNKEAKVWKRELLTSSIFAKFGALKLEQIHFYTSWFKVEEKFGQPESCMLLLSMHNCMFDRFSQIVELTLMMSELGFDDVSRMLNSYGPDPYDAFKRDWCHRRIQACSSMSKGGGISTKYSHKLAEKLCSGFNVSSISKLLSCLKSIDNLSAFENLISFCSSKKINLSDILEDNEHAELNDLIHLVEAKHLIKCAKNYPESEAEEKQFVQLFKTLRVKAGWNFAQLHDLVISFNPTSVKFNRFRNLMHFLNTIRIYNLFPTSNFGKSRQILIGETSFRTMMQKLNKLAVENHFQLEGKMKDPSELVGELRESNQHDDLLVEFIDRDAVNIRKHIFEEQSDKLKWMEKQIFVWAKDVKKKKEQWMEKQKDVKKKKEFFTDYEGIAVVLRANQLTTGHILTHTQILASLISLRDGGSPKGKLLEVATGEGKSTIVCILAIISALRGKAVDVITSSPVLAERDAKDKAKLFRMFGLTCSDNNDKTVYLRGAKCCYTADIVYGEMSQFQFDILRDSYSKLGTLGARKFATAIVDEVDSMLIDDSSKIARLSSTVAGMDHFQAIYVFIWQRLVSIKEKFIMFNGKLHFVDGKVGFENGKVTLEVADGNNDIVKIRDLEEYLVRSGDKSQVSEYVGDDIDDYLRRSLGHYLDCQIKENQIYIPSNFAPFLQKQKPKWITNAVEALNYQENVHYVVHNGEIKPVDYHSTGIVQSSTSWSDGLHQFLQLKHNLKMTSETMTTNFLSNMGLMNKYDRVYGMTGTLGSETARNVLKEVYEVDLVNIPQRRQKQYLELESIVAEGEDNWLKEIVTSVVRETQKERGILVICETIENTNRIRHVIWVSLRILVEKFESLHY